ncbi:FtsX-like permease family protein, partial [Bacillaceae bacterium Marseille-Q3522]|nr:FtsX-like permease family protein [Bacillaceae bacterium Marseille-Q3522]
NIKYRLENDDSGLIDVGFMDDMMNVQFGRIISDTDKLTQARVAIIPSNLGDVSILGKTIKLNDYLFTIIGIYEQEEQFLSTNHIYIPKRTFDKYFGGHNKMEYIEFYVMDNGRVQNIMNEVKQKLEKEGSNNNIGVYDITNTNEVSGNISQLFSVITSVVALIAGISLFIAGVGIMNMMYTSVSERKHEIGIKRALGATKKQILLQFLLEGIFITILGGLLGLIFGVIFTKLLSFVFPFSIQIDFAIVLLAIGISSLVGITFSFVPATNASKQNTIAILKWEKGGI